MVNIIDFIKEHNNDFFVPIMGSCKEPVDYLKGVFCDGGRYLRTSDSNGDVRSLLITRYNSNEILNIDWFILSDLKDFRALLREFISLYRYTTRYVTAYVDIRNEKSIKLSNNFFKGGTRKLYYDLVEGSNEGYIYSITMEELWKRYRTLVKI